MSVDSKGRQAVTRVELLVDCAIIQMPPILSVDRLQWKEEGLVRLSSTGGRDAFAVMIYIPWNEKLDAYCH